jgi:polysaccharide biosynthesis protein PslH
MRILVLALGVPFPPIGGGLTRTFHLLRTLASHHHVTLAAFTYGEPHEPAPYPIELLTAPWRWSRDYEAMTGADAEAAHRAYQYLTFESTDPWFASVMDPAALDDALAGARDAPYDVILLEGTPLVRLLPSLPPNVPRVLDLFDVHSVVAQRAASRVEGGDRALDHEFERTLAFERRAVQACDLCLAVSDQDATIARDWLGARAVRVVPNGVDTNYFTPASGDIDPGMMLFTGRMNYPPNADAVHYFVDDILPRIRNEVPAATLHVVGASPGGDLTALESENVIIHGRVEDVRPFHRRAAIVVVPIRDGGGTRLKVLEAAACGKPIVSTGLGAEGLPLRNGMELVIADTSAGFAAAVVALLRDPVRCAALGATAREATRALDWSTIGESCRTILESVVRDRA